ncbi:putative transposition, RNA-mediated [Lyophyllum shimeji]|uniref:Transposition, RNA-mediated n=1 Tax=Lyophyllum shimeji TaxID=47721 RepID=A0A9P3Q2T6_LYOSH|nr:putative transposition, RNA-mediated [Lyophyllum shimeji]
MAAFESAQEGIWLRALLKAIDHDVSHSPTTIRCDNNSAINLSEDPLLHARVKHVDIKYHFLRERVQSGEIAIKYTHTKQNVADIFTKALSRELFLRFRNLLGLK